MTHHLPKTARIHHKKVINTLFRTGKRWHGKCITLYYLALKKSSPTHQALFSAPKRRYKKATDRNKVKRSIKEAYRQHQHLLPSPQGGTTFLLAYLYQGKGATLPSYQVLLEDITASMYFLKERYKKDPSPSEG